MRVLVYDSKDILSSVWSAGQFIGNFSEVIPASTWTDAFEGLQNINERIHHLQFWGHGTFGTPIINNEKLNLEELKMSLKKKTTATSVIWFRSCSVFAGNKGYDFATEAIDTLNCKVVGHTFVISKPWITHQSGGYGLIPGQSPYWNLNEGIDENGQAIGSTPWKPNTCLVTDMMVPKNWWKI